MTAIEASSAGVRDMADGSLRITFEFEPRHARDAYSLFGQRGTPVAIAALKTASHEPEKPKGGLLSQWAAMRCGDDAFQAWICVTYPTEWTTACKLSAAGAERAAIVVRSTCDITSRAELDNDEGARARFDQYIRWPWQRHCIATGAAA